MTRSVDYAERTDTPSSSMLAYAGATTALTHNTATGLSKALSFTTTDTAITGTIARDVRGYVTARALTGDASAAWGWTYDAAGRLTGQSGTGLSSGGATYEYGASGKKTGESIALAFGPARTSTFAYTPEGRLEQATIAGQTTRYSFDAAGNLDKTKRGTEPTVTLAYDTAGRIVSMGDVAFGFDEATGRRISAKRSGEESVTYAWTEAGRLEHFADPARDTSATHTYDGNGQRTTSVVTSGSLTTTTTWTYDGLTLLAYAIGRSDGATSALTYLTSEGGRPIAGVWSSSEASAPVRFSILTNDRGDVVALTDAAGEVFATYGYDAFGAPRSDLTASRETSAAPHGPTIAAEQPLRYAGYVFDTHSGLYYCSQRYYDPQTMQFLTKDPARADGEESAYQYCGGDPVGKVDPTGLWTLDKLYSWYDKYLPVLGRIWKAWGIGQKVDTMRTWLSVLFSGPRRALQIFETYAIHWPLELEPYLLPHTGEPVPRTTRKQLALSRAIRERCGRSLPEYKKWVVRSARTMVIRGVEVAWDI